MKKSRKTLLIVLILVLVIAAMVAAWFYFGPNGVAGKKTITVEVTHLDGTTNTFEVKTAEEFLGPALENEKLISGSDSEYGLYVTSVCGIELIWSEENPHYWAFYINDEYAQTGVDSTEAEEGAVYLFKAE